MKKLIVGMILGMGIMLSINGAEESCSGIFTEIKGYVVYDHVNKKLDTIVGHPEHYCSPWIKIDQRDEIYKYLKK